MSDTITLIDGRPFVWRDAGGRLHRCVGADIHPGIRLVWTACEKHDVPANGSWLLRAEDRVGCPRCLAAQP
jgi:hypothetical protein